jgi:hypothetical protein
MATHTSSRVQGFPWKRAYRAVTLETNNAKLEKRIETAEATDALSSGWALVTAVLDKNLSLPL